MIVSLRRAVFSAALLLALAPAYAQKPPAPAKTAAAPAAPAAAPAKPAKGGGASPVLPGGNSKDPISIDADKLEYFDKEQKAIYSGKVVVVQGESSLKCNVLVLFLSKSTAAPQPTPVSAGGKAAASAGPAAGSGTEVRRMEAFGAVQVIQKDQVGTGDKGVYDKTENKVYLIDNVTLSQGPNITKGDKLTYDLDKGTAIVDSGPTKARVQGLFVPGSGGGDPNAPKKPKGDAKPAPKP